MEFQGLLPSAKQHTSCPFYVCAFMTKSMCSVGENIGNPYES